MTEGGVRLVARQQADGRWRARAESPRLSLTAPSLDACLRRARTAAGDRAVTVEAYPKLLGVAEVAALLGWDKRRVITYVSRGAFPEPVESLAGGRVWALDDVAAFRDAFRARQRRRPRR